LFLIKINWFKWKVAAKSLKFLLSHKTSTGQPISDYLKNIDNVSPHHFNALISHWTAYAVNHKIKFWKRFFYYGVRLKVSSKFIACLSGKSRRKHTYATSKSSWKWRGGLRYDQVTARQKNRNSARGSTS